MTVFEFRKTLIGFDVVWFSFPFEECFIFSVCSIDLVVGGQQRIRILLAVLLLTNSCVRYTACTNGAVRLQAGPPFLGRVEVCIEEEWGTVCRNQWGNQDAAVVCRQLGFVECRWLNYIIYVHVFYMTTFHMLVDGTALPFAGGSGAIHLDQVECSGTELFLLNCSHSGVGNNTCTHSLDAGVICYESKATCTWSLVNSMCNNDRTSIDC